MVNCSFCSLYLRISADGKVATTVSRLLKFGDCAGDERGAKLSREPGASDGDVIEGGITEGDIIEGDVVGWNCLEGETFEGAMNDGDVIEGDVIGGAMNDGDTPSGDEPIMSAEPLLLECPIAGAEAASRGEKA